MVLPKATRSPPTDEEAWTKLQAHQKQRFCPAFETERQLSKRSTILGA